MARNINILSLKKQLICCFVLLGFAFVSYANVSIGFGGEEGAKPKVPLNNKSSFTPLKSTLDFTLKAGPNYRSQNIFTESSSKAQTVIVKSVVTFQKGNATYIIPYKHRVSVSAAKSNMQAINLKVNFNR